MNSANGLPVMPVNIVFDLGNVLISFRPEEFLSGKNYSIALRETILSDIFHSREWQMIDEGGLTVEEATERILLKTSLKRHEITRIFDLRKEILFPLAGNIKLLPELKERGFKLYYLSNFPGDIFADIKHSYDFFRYFDGGIISAEVRIAKPDIRIYNLLIEKYSLIAGECLFIDDLEVNVQAAEKVGMKGFHTKGELLIADRLVERLGTL